jgi:hypothetical protein
MEVCAMNLVRGMFFVVTATILLMLSPASRAQSFAPVGDLDCNGYSKIQAPLRPLQRCADFTGAWGGRGYDNGHYIGHDEPGIGFISTVPHSGSNMQWDLTLTKDKPFPATQSFELFPTVWFSLALCDPNSYPNGACIPSSDENSPGFPGAPGGAGSAVLELQFYPPGYPPFVTQISCDMTHWCAALTIDSLEVQSNGQLNPNCTEPFNFAFIQTDGVPTGPPGPATATNATFAPNGQTLLMNQGDHLRLTIKDTPEGLLTLVEDLSTGQSGFMVAGAANGFQNTDPNTCEGTNFNFRPEFDTAKFGNFVPWAVLQANVDVSMEIGHFEVPDNDSDDSQCFPGPVIAGCLGADLDFDGPSYQLDWPGTSRNTSTPLKFGSVAGNGIGPISAAGNGNDYDNPYPIVHFEATVSDSETTCQPNGVGCVIPPVGAQFYPYYSLITNGGFEYGGEGQSCVLVFGGFSGPGIQNFGGDAQYGPSNLPWFFGQNTGGPVANPCLPTLGGR